MPYVYAFLLFFFLGAQDTTPNGLEFSQTDCKEDVDEPFGYPEKIISQEVKGGKVTVVVAIADLCCTTFIGDYSFADNQLQLQYTRTDDDACFCACAYQLRYTLPAPASTGYTVSINGRPLKRKL